MKFLHCFCLLLILVSTGCLTPKKLDRQVDIVYKDRPQQKKKQTEQISISSPLNAGSATSVSHRKTSNLVPLIVYISFKYSHICQLNPQIPISNFTNTVYGPAGKGLLKKLGDRKLQLSIEQVPTEFSIDDRGHLILLLIAWDNVSIEGKRTDMVVRYNITGDASKQGTITIPYPTDRMNLGYFKSWKKATTEYLDQYDNNIDLMAKQCVEKLEKEL